ncbi:MAG: N-acetylmuramoyl-L-alanine amidase [Erysipelotrichales bacterium]|nr:N-acetylmuramoyl-L-alanine amidase [Erysipelotrichales bacterium]
MKNFILLLIIGFLISGIIYKATKSENVTNEALTVIIDPGHGGIDGGAEFDGIIESHINLLISQKLALFLEENNITVILTRTGDYDLSKGALPRKRHDTHNRVRMINQSKANLYVSIHLNSSHPLDRGAQVFYTKTNSQSETIANMIQDSLIEVLQNTRRRPRIADTLYLIKNAKIPGVLVEAGFLSNCDERALLNDEEYQEKVAKAIGLGILNFLSYE